MTRETKIGLLVGLAFILVIGILLEDHFSSLQEPKPAQLTQAGENARRGYGAPSSGGSLSGEPVVRNVEPTRPVPSANEMNNQARAREIVQIDPGANAGGGVIRGADPRVTIGPAGGGMAGAGGAGGAGGMIAAQSNTGVAISQTPVVGSGAGAGAGAGAGVGGQLGDVASRIGEGLVPVGGGNTGNIGGAGGAVAGAGGAGAGGAGGARLAPGVMRTYKAEAGDSVSRMAQKLLGANTKTNRDAIIKANPSLVENPNKVDVGKIYNVPAATAVAGVPAPAPAAPAAPAPAVPAPAVPVAHGPAAAPAPAPAPVADRSGGMYTVKAGDTLWKIAQEQCGSGAAWAQIKALNREVLGDSELVKANMKLRLPERAVASTN